MTQKTKQKQKPSGKHSKTKNIQKATNKIQTSTHTQPHKKHLKNQISSENPKELKSHNLAADSDEQFDNNLVKEDRKHNKAYEQALSNQNTMKGFKRQKNKYFLTNEGRYAGFKEEQNEEGSDQGEDFEQVNEQEQSDNISEEAMESSQSEEFDVESQDEQEMVDEQSLDEENYEENDLKDESASNDILNVNANEDDQNEIKQALKALKKKRHQNYSLLNEDLQQINAADQEHIKEIKKSSKISSIEGYKEAVQLKKLLEVYDRLVEVRYSQQKHFQEIKQFPKKGPLSEALASKRDQLEGEVIANIDVLMKLYGDFGKKCFTNVVGDGEEEEVMEGEENQLFSKSLQEMIASEQENQKVVNNNERGQLNVEKVYQAVARKIQPYSEEAQKQLIKWSQKTSLLNSTSSSQYNSLIMQTPIGQSKKVLSNWDRISHKCQQKRGTAPMKILFQDQSTLHDASDPQIYDDYDLFIELEKHYLEKLDHDEDNEFLQSATMKYLKKRQADQFNRETKQNGKDVDRKASKNRKIRFNVHTKLLNFMPSSNEYCIETRDEIVRNIFNCKQMEEEEQLVGRDSRVQGRGSLGGHSEEADFIEV